MKRQEAEALIGTRVTAWTALNGVYTGTLIAVAGVPWRGRVRIDGVLELPTLWQVGRSGRRLGFRPGEEIEVGGSSILPEAPEGRTYLEALEAEREKWTRYRERPNPKDLAWLDPTIGALEAAIAEEKERCPRA